jgi:hypothetical protein
VPGTTKNASLGKTLSLAEKQESIQKLIGGVLEIFSKLFPFYPLTFCLESKPDVADAYKSEGPEVMPFNSNTDNEALRRTPEINFQMKSRPKHSGFQSQSQSGKK